MAANKFATMVHNNTNKLTLILIYVGLEWAIIIMLLLNALFSYLILRFSQFFGLQTPCIFCSRIDHIFDPTKKKNFHIDLLCKAHVSEVSNLRSCSSDREYCETINDTYKSNSIMELDRFEKRDGYEGIKLGYGLVSVACSVSETKRDNINLGTDIEDQSCYENFGKEIEECHDRNYDKFAVFESFETNENDYNSLFIQTKNCDSVDQQRDSDSLTGEAYQIQSNESEDDVSIGTEIPDIRSTDEFRPQETHLKEDDHDIKHVKEDVIELKTTSVDAINQLGTLRLELNGLVEEKILETPSSVKSPNPLYKSLLLLDEREPGADESCDGNVISDFEGSKSIEHLISILNDERKALNDLFKELEEERCANAIAANQTMAMINRLQEEKAAMQMDALHYQRMMEEQSQYDQEALEFLNELILKSEKEKRDLEKELEAYRKGSLEYEGKGNLKVIEKESESPTFSSSNCGDSDDLSTDDREDIGEESSDDGKMDQSIPLETILGKETNGKRIMTMRAKRLLPLFQATENGHANGNIMETSISKNDEFENRNSDIEEEFDRLYDRLQSLEADQKFHYLRQ